jgi:hypothetical protein
MKKSTLPRFVVWIACALLLPTIVSAELVHHCARAATEQAKKLLAFHSGGDNRAAIGDTVKTMPAMHNPANKK